MEAGTKVQPNQTRKMEVEEECMILCGCMSKMAFVRPVERMALGGSWFRLMNAFYSVFLGFFLLCHNNSLHRGCALLWHCRRGCFPVT